MLPSVPEWKFKKVALTGYTTKEPINLFYHNTLECVEYLFGNPMFADRVDFCPVQLYRNAERSIRIYNKWITGNAAWEMQVRALFSLFYLRPVSPLIRKCSQMVQHSSALSSLQTRPVFLS